ncbi:MAG: hypothetical protein MN733_30655, partial [Nitrososphaera sp.]|nr:hypothetical protein [Nitrososphaera sp.]
SPAFTRRFSRNYELVLPDLRYASPVITSLLSELRGRFSRNYVCKNQPFVSERTLQLRLFADDALINLNIHFFPMHP